MAYKTDDQKQIRRMKSLFAIVTTMVLSLFLAGPAVRLYDSLHTVNSGGIAAFVGGYFIVWVVLSGLFFGLCYKFWYKSPLLFLAFPIVWMAYSIIADYNEIPPHSTILEESLTLILALIAAFIVGFFVNKLSKFLYNVYREYKKLPRGGN